MACIHGLSPRDCHHFSCANHATAIVSSEVSTQQSDSAEESASSEGSASSDEVEIIVDGMKSTNGGGEGRSKQKHNPSSKKGM